MKNLLIIGARGFGREVFHLSRACAGYNTEYLIRGFLDDKTDSLNGYPGYPPIISSVEGYEIQNNDVFICALGDGKCRKKYAQIILDKGGEFITLVHPSIEIKSNTQIGKGCILARNASISCDVIIGDFVSIHPFSVIGHDVRIGNWSQLNASCFIGGFVEIAEEVTIHPGAIIHPRKKIARGATVGAGSFVIRNIEENSTVFGNPATKLK